MEKAKEEKELASVVVSVVATNGGSSLSVLKEDDG